MMVYGNYEKRLHQLNTQAFYNETIMRFFRKAGLQLPIKLAPAIRLVPQGRELPLLSGLDISVVRI